LTRWIRELTPGRLWLISAAIVIGYVPAYRATLGWDARIAQAQTEIDGIIERAYEGCAARACDLETDPVIRQVIEGVTSGKLSTSYLYEDRDKTQRLSNSYMLVIAPLMLFGLHWIWHAPKASV
jgi:hypothetical protein